VDNQVNKDVKCPDDSFSSKCINHRLIRSWKTFDVQNCACVANTQKDSVPNCKDIVCKNILPKHKCNKIRKSGKCRKLNIYFQFLCPATCGYCGKIFINFYPTKNETWCRIHVLYLIDLANLSDDL